MTLYQACEVSSTLSWAGIWSTLGMVGSVDIDPNGTVSIGWRGPSRVPMRNHLEGETSRRIAGLPGVRKE